MPTDGQSTKCRRNTAENLNRLSRAHECYRRQMTDGWAIAYSECEREIMFAKNPEWFYFSVASLPSCSWKRDH